MHPIQKYCKEKGITQKEFAEGAGFYPQEISNFINGRKLPGPIASERIEQFTGGEIAFRDLRPDIARLVMGEN